MSKGHINTFSQGMDKDTSPSKYQNTKYENANDFRLFTNSGLTTGAMVNIKGTQVLSTTPTLVKISLDTSVITNGPNIGNISPLDFTLNFTDGTTGFNTSGITIGGNTPNEKLAELKVFLEGQSSLTSAGLIIHDTKDNGLLLYCNVKNISTVSWSNPATVRTYGNQSIIGSTTLRDDLIMFTTDTASKVGSFGQIWKTEYNDSNLESNVSLVYAGDLNFSKEYPIEAVARYETPTTQRIYWTDFFNPLRSLEIVSPTRFEVPVRELAATPTVVMSQPEIREILTNGALIEGTYQTAYRLLNSDGKTTELSPWSSPVNINNMSEDVEHWDYGRSGDFSEVPETEDYIPKYVAAKGLSISITDIPEGYEFIEVFVLRRGQALGVITKVDDFPIAGATETIVTYLGNEESNELVRPEDIINFNIAFERVKTITIKDNRLLVGNIEEYEIPKDFDTRAYRYQAVGEDFDGVNADPDYIDGIDDRNPYNRDSTSRRLQVNAPGANPIVEGDGSNPGEFFAWKKGTTPVKGGSGANISYEFVQKDLKLDKKDTTNQNPVIEPQEFSEIKIKKTVNGASADETFYGSNLRSTYQNPYLENRLAGYQRSEVYRFGIVFYNVTGKATDVRWIGDIRMPDDYQSDSKYSSYAAFTREFSTSDLIGRALGLEFTVDVTDIKDNITGFSIVRSPRPNKDRTILGQGMLHDTIFCDFASDAAKAFRGDLVGTSITPIYEDTDNSVRNIDRIDNNYNTGYTPTESTTNNVTTHGPTKRLHTFDCPQIMSGVGSSTEYGEVITDQGIDANFAGKGLQYRPVRRYSRGGYVLTDAEKELPSGGIVSSKRTYAKYYTATANFNNFDRGTGAPIFTRPINAAQKISSGQSIPLADFAPAAGFPNIDYVNTAYGKRSLGGYSILTHMDGTLADAYGTNIDNPAYLSTYRDKVVANIYFENNEQYGGDTEVDRGLSEYISTGHYQRVLPTDTSFVYTSEVYGGDTYLNLVPVTKHFALAGDDNDVTGWDSDTLDDANSRHKRHWAGYVFPVESTHNIDVILRQSWADPKYTNEQITVFGTQETTWDALPTGGAAWSGSFVDPSPWKNLGFYFPNTSNGFDDVTNYQAENTAQKYYPLAANFRSSSYFDNRIYASQVKINGELADSWGSFKALDYLDVDGHQGPLNKLEVLNESVIFLQDKGFGVVAVSPRSVITDADGAELQLGVGTVLQDYNYISTEVGSRHQFGTMKSKRGFYFFDSNSRKWHRFTGKNEPLSDLKSMSAYFYNNFKGPILYDDNPLIRSGINCGFDPRYNEILMTYHDGDDVVSDADSIVVSKVSPPGSGIFTIIVTDAVATDLLDGAKLYVRDKTDSIIGPAPVGSTTSPTEGYALADVTSIQPLVPTAPSGETTIVTFTCDLPVFNSNTFINTDNPEDPFSTTLLYKISKYVAEREATVVFSENIDAFSGFYSFTPTTYINDSARYFSPNPDVPTELHVHEEGERGVFYDKDPSRSSIRLIVNPKGDYTKVFNTIEYLGQMKDSSGNDIVTETFDTIRVYNEYQDTGEIPLVNIENIRRRMRTWRTNVPRSGTEFARIRNPYTTIELSFLNNEDKEIVINDIITYYLDIPM
jgi:hypothetical protein